ncbi:protein of unknown function [Clostridium beijerinckii]|nr:protein of unknown function [Clostridium beijerinckii]
MIGFLERKNLIIEHYSNELKPVQDRHAVTLLILSYIIVMACLSPKKFLSACLTY